MQKNLQNGNLKKDWEKLLCLGVFLVILLAAAAGVSHWLKEKGGGNASRQVIPVVPKFLDLDHLNLFDKEKGIAVPKNPMAFVKKNAMVYAAPKKHPPKVKPKQKPAAPAAVKRPEPRPAPAPQKARPAPAPAKAQAAAPVKQRPAAPPKPKKPVVPPRVITVVYTGLYRGLKQHNAAFVEVHDSKGNQSYSSVVTAGDRISGVLLVKEVGDGKMILQHSGDKTGELQRDRVWKVELHE